VYVATGAGGDYAKLVFQFNWDHALATDTADKGHLLKSRALESDVLYNRITGESGHDSYEVDLPNGGIGIIVGNVIEKGTDPDNSILLDYGEEGYEDGGTNELYVVGNTFVNDFTSGTFIEVASGGTLAAAHDNILAGPGTPATTGSLSADNLTGTEASFLFVDAGAYDYHLQAASPAIGQAVAPGSAGAISLTPVYEYVQPLGSVARLADDDVGAFEYGTSVSANDDGGLAALDGSPGAPGPDDGGASSDGGSEGTGDGGVGGNASSSSSGCGCAEAGREAGSVGAWLGAVLLGAGLRRRRSRS
jgi:hypothetical protein